jgi:hypothetical protein
MEIGTHAQICANAYREIGDQNGWRKGRNSSRGYDMLTIPGPAWDDRPHERYLLVVNQHLSSAATQLDACGSCHESGNLSAVLTLARAVFVESSKVSWLLEGDVMWTKRAARAHLELLANLDMYVRRQPKRLESGHPNFRRRQWKVYRDQLRDEAIGKLFGKRALSKRDDTLIGEALLTSAHLEDQFADLLCVNGPDGLKGTCVSAPDLLIDPLAPLEVLLATPSVVDRTTVDKSVVIAIQAWLAALDAWIRYNAWETDALDRLCDQLPSLFGPTS